MQQLLLADDLTYSNFLLISLKNFRYRRNLVGDLEPSRLREIKDAYESIKKVHAKAEKIILQLAKNGDLTIPVFNLIKAAQTFEELDFIVSYLLQFIFGLK